MHSTDRASERSRGAPALLQLVKQSSTTHAWQHRYIASRQSVTLRFATRANYTLRMRALPSSTKPPQSQGQTLRPHRSSQPVQKKPDSGFDVELEDHLSDSDEDNALDSVAQQHAEFYDSQEDDRDEQWVQQQRQGRRSDAVLSCPGCLTTVCIDCQRHEFITTQYRAMFVTNCRYELCD